MDDRNKVEMKDVYGIIGNDTYYQINDQVDMLLGPTGAYESKYKHGIDGYSLIIFVANILLALHLLHIYEHI